MILRLEIGLGLVLRHLTRDATLPPLEYEGACTSHPECHQNPNVCLTQCRNLPDVGFDLLVLVHHLDLSARALRVRVEVKIGFELLRFGVRVEIG